MNRFASYRLVKLFFILLAGFAVLVVHLAVIQLAKGDHYASLALARQSLTVSLEDYQRGKILDRHLNSLTGDIQANRLVVFPELIPDRPKTAFWLAEILKTDPSAVLPYLSKEPCYLPFSLTPEQAEKVRRQNQAGVLVLPVNFRYGVQPLAVQVVGYLGHMHSYDELENLSRDSKKVYHFNDLVGKSGLEKYYESELKGTSPSAAARVFTDATGRTFPGIRVDTLERDPGRHNIVTTIDAGIQQKVEEIMDKKIKEGAVVVMEPRSGDILAMAGRPSFDPRPEALAHYLETSPQGAFLDQCTTLFQPGSVFKIVVAAAALAEGLATTQSTFTCRGKQDPLVSCWYAPGHGQITLADAFAQSCDPSFAQVALKLGADRLIAYSRLFGLENQAITGYQVPRDNRQDLKLIGAGHALVNSSIGQGPVLATPVQIAAMLNVIANNGIYVQPRLVKEIRSTDNQVVRTFPADKGHRVIPAATAAQIQHMLQLTTSRGTGKAGYVPGAGSAGKTGTAQIDGKSKLNAWFCGYAPLDHPRYVVVVLARGDKVSGGGTAAPVFREIVSSLLNNKR